MGMTGSLCKWFRASLMNPAHFSCINNTSSSLLQVYSGVPQVGILGPLLFLNINDLSQANSHSSMLLFADGVKLVKSISSSYNHSLLQLDLDSLTSWGQKWKLTLSTSKCATVTISNKIKASAPYKIDGNSLPIIWTYKDFGLGSYDKRQLQLVRPL